MTREEAIELLCAYGVPQNEKRFQEALDMAIEALSANATVAKIQIADIDKAKTSSQLLDDLAVDMVKAMGKRIVEVVRCKDCRHGEHIQIPIWENRDIDKAPSQFHDFIKCHKFHIKGFNETLYLGDDDYCSRGERREE